MMTLPDRGEFLIAGMEKPPRPQYEFLVGGDLMVAHHAYPAELCEGLLAAVSGITAWSSSTLAPPGNGPAYVDTSRRSSSKLTLAEHRSLRTYEDALVRVAQACLSIYQMRNTYANVSGTPIFELLRYTLGQRFDEHIDLIPGHAAWGRRRVSVLIYPNEDYEGGELVFARQRLTIKPRAGSVVLFPSDYTFPHASTPVTKGAKFAAVAWFT